MKLKRKRKKKEKKEKKKEENGANRLRRTETRRQDQLVELQN